MIDEVDDSRTGQRQADQGEDHTPCLFVGEGEEIKEGRVEGKEKLVMTNSFIKR